MDANLNVNADGDDDNSNNSKEARLSKPSPSPRISIVSMIEIVVALDFYADHAKKELEKSNGMSFHWSQTLTKIQKAKQELFAMPVAGFTNTDVEEKGNSSNG